MSSCRTCDLEICYECLQKIEGFEDVQVPHPHYIDFDNKQDPNHRACPRCSDKINQITLEDIIAYGRFMMKKNGIETLSQLKTAMTKKTKKKS